MMPEVHNMEKEFKELQDQLCRSEVTEIDNGADDIQLLYNGFFDLLRFNNQIDKYVSQFIVQLYDTRKLSITEQFDIYNEFLRRWHSLKPYFVLDETQRVIGHRGLQIDRNDFLKDINDFIINKFLMGYGALVVF